MKYFFTLLILTSTLCAAQDSISIYLDYKYMQTDSINASINRVAIISDGLYTVIDKDMSGKMMGYCELTSLEPKIQNGLTIHYKDPGEIYSKGYYVDGQLSGIWYYYADNKIIDTVDYTFVKTYEMHQNCNISTSIKEPKKIRVLKKKIVESLIRYLNSRIILPARAIPDGISFNVDINIRLESDGQISCIEFLEPFSQDLYVEIIRILKDYEYDEEINQPIEIAFTYTWSDEIYFIVEEMPTFDNGSKDNFRQYISENLTYPEVAAKNGKQGRVFVQFVVNEYGKVTDVKIVRGADPALDAEALRVVRSSPKWQPGKQKGKPVKVQFTFPIVFVLGN